MKYLFIAFFLFIAICTVYLACAIDDVLWRGILTGCGVFTLFMTACETLRDD